MAEGTRVRTHLCGITTAWTEAEEADAAIAEIGAAIGGRSVAQIVAFFSADYDVETLNRALTARFPGAGIAGCTMSGGISPAGGLDRGLVVIAFPRENFRIVSTLLDAIDHLDVERTASSVRAIDSRAMRATILPTRGLTTDGTPRLSVSDTTSTCTPVPL